MIPKEKRCPMCGQTKPAQEFYTRRWTNKKTGRAYSRLGAYCKPCERVYTRQLIQHKYRTDPTFRKKVRDDLRRRRRKKKRENREFRRWRISATQRHLETLRRQGKTWREIAQALGVVEDTLYRWRRGINAPRRHLLNKLRDLTDGPTSVTS